MKQNMGSLDRIIRLIAAVAAGIIGYFLGGTWSWVLYIVGAILLLTSATGWCPLYVPFRLSTPPKEPARSK